MTIEEIRDLCILYEKLKAGGRNCKDINKVYATVPSNNKPQGKVTKNQKIKVIQGFFETLADETLKKYLVNKQYSGETQNNESSI